MRGASNRYSVNSSVYPEDDSLESSEYSTGASIENLPRKDGYASDVSSRVNVDDISSRKDSNGRNIQSSMEDVLSAHPISGSFATRLPTFHASSLGLWHAVITYDACVRLCLHAWAEGCMEEAHYFLNNECALLRSTFGLQQVLLQSEEELLKHCLESGSQGAAPKQKKMVGRMKLQVRKVKMTLDSPKGKLETLGRYFAIVKSKVSSGWQAVRSSQNVKQLSGLLRVGVSTLCSSSSAYEEQESYSCQIRLKSSSEGDTIRMKPGSGETHIFFPDSLGDDLIVEVQDSKGKHCGRVLAQVAIISENQKDKLRWWSIYLEPQHEVVGKIQLYINYTTSLNENGLKCGPIFETMAYDLVLDVAMKERKFQQTKLQLHDPWKWLLTEFASFYGISRVYTKLRYLSYIMDVATPTKDCLSLVYDLLLPVLKENTRSTLSHQGIRILGQIEDQIKVIFAVVFENYKALDESSPSGMMDVCRPATGVAAPVLEPAVELYKLLHNISSPEAQHKLCSYFQAAAKKRSQMHLADTNEYLSGTGEGNLILMDAVTVAYKKMKSLCLNIRHEVLTDIEIYKCNILPSFINLPVLSSAVYSADLCRRLQIVLAACPPTRPSLHVTELLIATADFQKDLATWNINPEKGGVDAKELFDLYIINWIQVKRLSLLETCKLVKVKCSGVRTQSSTTPFVDQIYDRLKDTLDEYDIILCRWPEYTFALENAILDVEKAVIEALDKQYADVLAPLKENLAPKKLGVKYVQKLTKRTPTPYVAPSEVSLLVGCDNFVHSNVLVNFLFQIGILLNSMKRMSDVLCPKIEVQLKSWGSFCIPNEGSTSAGERLSDVTVLLGSKLRNYLQAIVEKLFENTRLQNGTKLKKILRDSKECLAEIRSRMQPLTEQLTTTVNHLHTNFESQIFIALCRGYWDRIGQDVLRFLENVKENKSSYKGSRVVVSILNDTFSSQMQKLLGHALEEKDLEPPRSIIELQSMLC